MTSNPASRSARATTFAPRSCPSRPGLATMIRSFSAGTSANISERVRPHPGRGRLRPGDLGNTGVMTTERYIAQARQAAAELRAEGQPVLPLADAYQLSPATRRLLQALVGLRIVAPDE